MAAGCWPVDAISGDTDATISAALSPMVSVERTRMTCGATPGGVTRRAILGAMAGEVRARIFGARIPSGCQWVHYDSLEVLPYLAEAEVATSAVVVDLMRWAPLKAAPSLCALRRRQPTLRIVCLYEPSPDTLVQLKGLVELDLDLAFAVDPDDRFELLVKPLPRVPAAEAPSAGRMLLKRLAPFAPGGALESALIQLALAPSERQTVSALARIAGCSVDGLERRFFQAGLATPVAVRGLAVAAEALWQIAARGHSTRETALAVGLSTGDALGRSLKRWFGFGLKRARLVGAGGARGALEWTGLLALREFASLRGLLSLAGGRPAPFGEAQVASGGANLLGDAASGWPHCDPLSGAVVASLLAGGAPLEEVMVQLSRTVPPEQAGPAMGLALRTLLRQSPPTRPMDS